MARIRELRGSARKEPTPSEIETGHVASFRRALYPARDLPSGHVLQAEDLVALRPNEGIGAEHLTAVVGRATRRALGRLEPLSWDLLD